MVVAGVTYDLGVVAAFGPSSAPAPFLSPYCQPPPAHQPLPAHFNSATHIAMRPGELPLPRSVCLSRLCVISSGSLCAGFSVWFVDLYCFCIVPLGLPLGVSALYKRFYVTLAHGLCGDTLSGCVSVCLCLSVCLSLPHTHTPPFACTRPYTPPPPAPPP